ncbi:MAG: F0F1 ATP synthase subunit B [Acidimicrobiales bacterium]|nr:F0F1 ATP synthase subunit B [Acidimicrobiales bacterium]
MRFRTRAMLASSLLAVGLVAFAPHASAQEGEVGPSEAETEEAAHHLEEIAEENGGTHADVECIPILAEGGSVDDCQESPSPILPATDELLWGTLSFLVLFFLMRKFAYPAIKEGMEGRSERIRSDLAAAETAKAEAQGVLDSYRSDLSGAKAEAGRIIEEARQAADALKKDQEARLQTELADVRTRATADIEAAKAQAIADLKGEVAQLAVGAASVVVNKNLDVATQTQLIEDYINQVATKR